MYHIFPLILHMYIRMYACVLDYALSQKGSYRQRERERAVAAPISARVFDDCCCSSQTLLTLLIHYKRH
jgi:hypothetical protein